MKKLFRYIFNHDQLKSLKEIVSNKTETIDIYIERCNQLEKEIKELEGYKLKYEITKLYVEDDDALLEIFEANKLFEEHFKKAESMKVKSVSSARENYIRGIDSSAHAYNLAASQAQQLGWLAAGNAQRNMQAGFGYASLGGSVLSGVIQTGRIYE